MKDSHPNNQNTVVMRLHMTRHMRSATPLRLFPCALLLATCVQATVSVTLELARPEWPLASPGPGQKTLRVKANGELGNVTLTLEARLFGTPTPCAKATRRAEPETTLDLDLPAVGLYDLTCMASRDNAEIARAQTRYAVLPPVAEPLREMGVCTHFAQRDMHAGTTFKLLKWAGFSRIRDDLTWGAIEPRPRAYTIPSKFDRLVDTANASGIRVLFVTGYPSPAYTFEKSFPTTDTQRQAFANASAFAVRHFGDRVREWEIWNEPNQMHPVNDYLPILKAVYPAIKAANPRATVISCGGGGAGGGPGGAMIIPIVNAGGLEFQDAFSIHPYMSPNTPDFGYKADGGPIPRVSIDVFTPHLHDRFALKHPKADGSRLALWVTEIGWPVTQKPTTELDQAAYLARTYLLFRATRSQAPVYCYDFQDDGLNPAEKEHNFGLVRPDYAPKPAYQALAAMAAAIGNLSFTRAIRDSDPALESGAAKVYVYGEDDRQTIAAWSGDDAPHRVTVTLPLPYEKTTMTDWQGHPRALPPAESGNRVTLTLGALPLYLLPQ